MKKIPTMLMAGAMVFMLSSCGQVKDTGEVQTDTVNDITQSSIEAEETDSDGKEDTTYVVLDHLVGEHDYKSKDGNGKLTIQKTSDGYDIVGTTAEKFVDYEALGIKEYEYPSEFIMGDNLKTALAELALSYKSFNSDTPKTEGWKETFIAKFIQNSRLSFDYLDLISDQNNGQISIDELNYMQYSLTNTELDFSSTVNGFVDRYEAASFFSHGSISGYDYEDTDSGVLITADVEVRYDGTEDVQKCEITAELVRNPYSCFDGYSIAFFSSTIADNLQGRT